MLYAICMRNHRIIIGNVAVLAFPVFGAVHKISIAHVILTVDLGCVYYSLHTPARYHTVHCTLPHHTTIPCIRVITPCYRILHHTVLQAAAHTRWRRLCGGVQRIMLRRKGVLRVGVQHKGGLLYAPYDLHGLNALPVPPATECSVWVHSTQV